MFVAKIENSWIFAAEVNCEFPPWCECVLSGDGLICVVE